MKKLIAFAVVLFATVGMVLGQAISVNGGSIQGTITDATGAVVPNANLQVTGSDTGSSKTLTTDSAGFFSIGPLNPGPYKVLVTAPGFQKLSVTTVVRTGTVTSGNFKLAIGQSSETVEVNAGSVQLNTEQAGVSAVITQKQFDTLPVNGRNFLDFAQLQPGVQLQAGGSGDGGFDPTKAGYSALSFSGISGRTSRILLDGQDITDETVGTTIFNVSQGSVGEMQVSSATSDVSTEITASGSVLASTRSGTNGFHGQLFYAFQDQRVGASSNQGIDAPFQRNQFGGSIGGPIIKDKLFFFANSERLKQDQQQAAQLGSLLSAVQAAHPSIPSPARDTYSAGRLDYNGPKGIHFFARVNYEANSFQTGTSYAIYANRDNAPGIAGGADFVTGRFTHSIRGSYEKFHNLIGDATNGNTSIYNPIPGLLIDFPAQSLESGPNDNAPQFTYQSDKQIRYDGSWSKGRQSFRYGVSINRILQNGYASFFGFGPRAAISASTLLPGADPTDPVNSYFTSQLVLGNGQGFSTEIPGFGNPAGGGTDWRTGVYIADTIKLAPTFTLTVAARYQRDTGRTNSDLPVIPCSAVDAGAFGGQVPCTGNSPLLDTFGPGLSGRVQQPNKNVGPQIGFTYNPAASPKTVFRGGVGIYFDDTVFNVVQFDRAPKLATGHFFNDTVVCQGGNFVVAGLPVSPTTGNTVTSTGQDVGTLCGESLAQSGPGFKQLFADYAAANTQPGPNPGFVGETLNVNAANGVTGIAPSYRSPYSIDWNFGIQREITPGVVFTADYVHVATLHFLQQSDTNHVGDAAYFNKTAAMNAVQATLVACKATTVQGAIQACPGLHPGVGGAPSGGAVIADFASNGLDSGGLLFGGSPASAVGATPDTGAAFAGVNPLVGISDFAYPNGKSAYDGLQLSLREQKAHPVKGVLDSNFQVSYAYSRFITTGGVGGTGSTSDQFFEPPTYDNRNATQYMGYGGLDRTHIFSVGGSATLKYGPRVSLIGHFNSAAPTNLTIDTGSDAAGEIFRSDVTGDGTTGDLVPGTNPGAYMRKVGPNNLNTLINRYNSTVGGTLTPAGQVVAASGVLSAAQLVQLGATATVLGNAPSHAFPNSPIRQLDAGVSYPFRWHRLPEAISLEPSVEMYNVLNLGNFGGPIGAITTAANAAEGNVNGPYTEATKNAERVARRTGTFDQGAPRATEFQLKVNF
jgi:hypothetical protein